LRRCSTSTISGGRAAQGRPRGPGAVSRPRGARVAPGQGRREAQVNKLTAQAKAYLKAGDREIQPVQDRAADDRRPRGSLEENKAAARDARGRRTQNNLKKIQHANKKLVEVKEKITRYDAELKMSEAEAEVAKLSQSFDINLTTDFGQLESIIQGKIDANRGKARVASDLSTEGMDQIVAEERMEKSMAEDALKGLEIELGMRAPETSAVVDTAKDLGPAEPAKQTE
jgi:hypothetical protein